MAATQPKQPVTGAGPFNGLVTWVDQRFPLMSKNSEEATSPAVLRAEEFQLVFHRLAAWRCWCW